MIEPLGIYLHVPFCKHACPYCDFYKMELRDRPARTRLEYPGELSSEHALILQTHPELAARPLASIYFGGGTPSVLSPSAVRELVSDIRERHAPGEPEVTLEANPENLTPARCDAWRAAGVTRLSIGVQSFHERDLIRLERLHDQQAIYRAIVNARVAGFDNISIDLMFGLPEQTSDEWQENLRRAVELGVEHISFYGLTIHENTPFWDEHRGGKLALPGDEREARMYLEGSEYLRDAGFEHYEISNFARPGKRSIHNQRYWRAEDVIGLGAGAHSSLGTLRWQNPDDLDAWQAAVRAAQLPRSAPEELERRVLLEEELFRRMRTSDGFQFDTGSAADLLFAKWLESPRGAAAIDEGWGVVNDNRARLTTRGWLVSDALLLDILKTG